MLDSTEWLSRRIGRRLDIPPENRAVAVGAWYRAILLAALWTAFTYALTDALRTVDQSFLLLIGMLYGALKFIGSFLLLIPVGYLVLLGFLALPKDYFSGSSGPARIFGIAALAVMTTGLSHLILWQMEGTGVREQLPNSIILPLMLGFLLAWRFTLGVRKAAEE